MIDKVKQELREETAKLLYYIRTCSSECPMGRDWGKCLNKKLWLSNADQILAKAEPLIRKDEREKKLREVKELGILPGHQFEFYVDEVGKQQKKHLPDCKRCRFEALKGED